MADPKLNLPLKLEADRVESADYVLWAIQTYGETLTHRLGSRSPDESDGTTATQVMVGWYQEQTTHVRSLLVRQCRTYRAAKTERAAGWRRLDDTARTVGKAVAGIRDQFFSTYGEDFALSLGFARQTPRRYVELLEYVGYLVERLDRRPAEMPEPAPGRLPIDVAGQLALVVPLHRSLEDARDAYHVARREAQAALAARNEAVEAFDAHFPWLAGGFENLLRMADLKPLAAAVRPSSRRKGLIARVAGEAPEPEEPKEQESISGEEPSSLLDEERTSEGSAFPPASDDYRAAPVTSPSSASFPTVAVTSTTSEPNTTSRWTSERLQPTAASSSGVIASPPRAMPRGSGPIEPSSPPGGGQTATCEAAGTCRGRGAS